MLPQLMATAPIQHHELQPTFILCTRDKSLASHPGNVFFRQHIETILETYKKATTKLQKMNLTKQVVHELQIDHNRKFVRFDEQTASWIEADNLVAREKVGHAIRFAIRRHEKKATKGKRRKPVPSRQSFPSPTHVECDSSDESAGSLDEQARKSMFDQPAKDSEPTMSNMNLAPLEEEEQMPFSFDVEPVDLSENTSTGVWTKDDVDFLFNETNLFQESV